MTTQFGIKISQFQGFSKHLAEKELTEVLKEIKGTAQRENIEKIRKLIAEGKQEEAARIKRQLKPFTLSAIYRERRIPECIAGYNDLLLLDLDKLAQEEMILCDAALRKDENVLFFFISPSGNGIKAGIYMQNREAERLREGLLAKEKIGFPELEMYHKRMFEVMRMHFERLTGIQIDISGSDIGRLFFTSHDPNLFINSDTWEMVKIPTVQIIPLPTETGRAKSGKGKLYKQAFPGNPTVDCSKVDPMLMMEFQRCVKSVKRSMVFESGQRDTFLYALGNKCYQHNLPEPITAILAEREFGAPDLDVKTPIANAYRYTSKTELATDEKKKPVVRRIIEYLDEHYEIRRNIILERLEFRKKTVEKDAPFLPMKKQDYNTVYVGAHMAGISCQLTVVKSTINSDYARDFNPFTDYFYNLAPWDGKTDYIDELAKTVRTTNQAFWHDCLKRWLVGMVACAISDSIVNQLALIIKGDQGKGKSTWIRNLLPPELGTYYRNGMLNPENKDHMLMLSHCLLINLEEFEGMKNGSIAELKRLITQESVTERRAFETDAALYVRRASFIASTNEPRFLQDISGSRRFPSVTAVEIDYRRPVNHAGIFSQAIHLLKNRFRYWYEAEEIEMLNELNREYSLASNEEELFYTLFRQPLPEDLCPKWLTASAIMTQVSNLGRMMVNEKTTRNLVKILERDEFRKRMNDNGLIEYEVVQFTFEEIEKNAKRQLR